MDRVAALITEVLRAPEDEANLERVRGRVAELCVGFPLYPDLA